MKSLTIHLNDSKTLISELSKSITTDFQPTLGIVFSSIKHNIPDIQNAFNHLNIDLVGCSTAGEIINNQLLEESIVILLMDMNPDFYSIVSAEHSEMPYQHGFDLGTSLKGKYENIGTLIMMSGFGVDITSIINGIKDGVGEEIPMYGGLAADDLQMKEPFVFSNQVMTSNGSVLLVIDTDKIAINGLATSGWQAIGVEKTITKSENNVIYEIDNERAYDVFTRYFGFTNKSNTIEHLLSLQTNYPLQLIRDTDTILRSPLTIDENEGTLTLMGSVKEGDKFRFSNAPGFEVIEETITIYQNLKDEVPDADALILFSCKGRHGAFGPLIEDEIEGLYNYWKTPMIGLLAYGEIGNTSNGTCEFHNETCSLVTLTER